MKFVVHATSRWIVTKTPTLTFRRLGVLWSAIFLAAGAAAAEAPQQQNISDLIDLNRLAAQGKALVTNLEEIQNQGLTSARLKVTPWSGSSWPVYKGLLGNRYASHEFVAAGKDWATYNNYVSTRKLSDIVAHGDFDEIDALAPSEKYDLLLSGSADQSQLYQRGYLTTSMWREGEHHLEENGSIEHWNGICHGWAPASIFTPRPRRTVPAAAGPDGTTIVRFYPADLKALSSFLWSRFHFPIHLLGERCNSPHPATDPANGHILEASCAGINPSLWHLAMVNQLGVAQRAVVLNVTQTNAISNQPVFSYSYRTFNPRSGKVAPLEQAIVPVTAYPNDKFKKYRAPQAAFVVGVRMEINYTVVAPPNHREIDSPEDDSIKKASYVYELELDSERNLIGGEWLGHHAAFLWTPEEGTHAQSEGETVSAAVGTAAWTPALPLPAFWREIGIRTAITSGEPLAAIIDPLIHEANPNND